MKKGRTKCGKNREGWCRLRRRVCGLAMAVLLAGCADGQETGDGARGTDDILISIGESDGQAIGEPDRGLAGEAAEKPPGESDGNLAGGVGWAEGNPGAEANGEAPGSSGEASTGNASGENGEGLPGTAADEPVGGRPGDTGQERAESAGEPEITLVMVGDILLHTPVAESGLVEDGNYDFSAVFAQMKEEIQAADLALVNQEVILGGAQLGVSGYPAFNAPYELGDALADTGFDVILHATNHALDKGKKGILNCLSFWQENYPDIAVLGIHDSQEAQQEIYVYEQQGIRIAILNYTYGTNGIPLPGDMPYAVDLLDRERVAEDLRRAGELADFVVVCPHWGTEYTLSATREQEEWAALFAENGADLILGTHPHVIEPVGWVGASWSIIPGQFRELDFRHRRRGGQPDGGRHGQGDHRAGRCRRSCHKGLRCGAFGLPCRTGLRGRHGLSSGQIHRRTGRTERNRETGQHLFAGILQTAGAECLWTESVEVSPYRHFAAVDKQEPEC